DKLQGTWRVVGIVRDGKRFDQDDNNPRYLSFDRGERHFSFVSGRGRQTVGRGDGRGGGTQAGGEFEYRLPEIGIVKYLYINEIKILEISSSLNLSLTIHLYNEHLNYSTYLLIFIKNEIKLVEIPSEAPLPRSKDDLTAEKGFGRSVLFLARRPGLP